MHLFSVVKRRKRKSVAEIRNELKPIGYKTNENLNKLLAISKNALKIPDAEKVSFYKFLLSDL